MSLRPNESFRFALVFASGWMATAAAFVLLGGGQLAWSMLLVGTPFGFAVSWWGQTRKAKRDHSD